MELEVRSLIGKYGLIAVREFVEAECKATWEYLKNIYTSPVLEKSVDKEPPSMIESKVIVECTPTTEKLEEESEKVPIIKKLIQRKPVKVIDFLTSSQPESDSPPKNVLILEKDPVFEDEEECDFEEEEQIHQEDDTMIKEVTTYRVKTKEERDEEKRKHKEAVKAKRDELQKQGIRPSSLLTKENLKEWLGAGMSYQRIAREKVGLNETIISHECEKHGLKSQVAGLMRRKGGV